MARLPEYFNLGDTSDFSQEDFLRVLQRMYTDLAIAINQKADVYSRDTDGQTTDTFLPQGSININTNTNKVEILTNHVDTTTVTWTTIS